ncbi:hypothetical protein TSUD_80440 [Trifolium subterraneum]|uniref:Uncharacterized protein n=1 Tax=Trifolium subterraneum TaxID=3900 RepID=A0A2Z6MR90_TRISU|nr:hypothetical protein TSUD_80440 [Trifolium subterraneum]
MFHLLQYLEQIGENNSYGGLKIKWFKASSGIHKKKSSFKGKKLRLAISATSRLFPISLPSCFGAAVQSIICLRRLCRTFRIGTMAKRKGRGRPKGSSVQKKAKQSANVETAVLDNPSNELEIEFVEEQETGTYGFTLSDSPVPVDPGFVEEHETGTKRKGRGQPKGSSVQKKAKQSANVKIAVLDNPSDESEIDPEFIEEQEIGTMAKRKGRGRPKGSSVQKKAKQSAHAETAVLDNPSNELEVDPEFVEEQETGTHGFTLSDSPVQVEPGFVAEQETDMPKKRGRGRPIRSRDQNCRESDRRNVSSPINLLNMVENVHGCEESENADLQDYVVDNPSNKLEVAPGFVEEQERDMPMKRGRGRPKRSRDQTCQEIVHTNATSPVSASNTVQAVHACEESGNAVRPNKKEQRQPRELRLQNCHRNPDGTDIYDDSSNMMEDRPVDKEESDVGSLSVTS